VSLAQYVISFGIEDITRNSNIARWCTLRPPPFAMLLIKAILTKHLGARRT
jgi:hypothetical protein